MINVLVPLAGKTTFETNSNNSFPKILSDIGGELLIERAAKPFIQLGSDKKIVVAVPKLEVEKYKLNNVIPLLSDDVELCIINGDTKGAACSALLAIENLDLDEPLIISSFEQVIDFDIQPFIDDIVSSDIDAAVLTFESIHPKWSYVKVDSEGFVTQAAEKDPISKNAIAGVYFYRTARHFLESAKNMIRKDVKTNGLFFIAPTLNEIILSEGLVKAFPIDKSKYFHINDEHALVTFEDKVAADNDSEQRKIIELTKEYVTSFNNRDGDKLRGLLSDRFALNDPSVSIIGCDEVMTYIESIFNGSSRFSFKARKIFASSNRQSVIEFELTIDETTFLGVDIIHWNNKLEMLTMDAYLYEGHNGKK
ncbi:nuclear transport factor 2 family protein [Vibrio mediterranei]|uniref:nuclear transport factor 2 family protein n=1 Tax=Vibrio mediterranei TaxID=689 RepID=UPI0017CC1786|nr:nuclear transport factor 2 family protein [Vibrio mediterranei]NUW73827.1 nuclear transport factor 2 family protein [Vibrio mediterranei]